MKPFNLEIVHLYIYPGCKFNIFQIYFLHHIKKLPEKLAHPVLNAYPGI